LTYFPIAYLTLRSVLAAIGGNLEEMAFSLGSSRRNVFRTVTLPLAVPGLANAFLLLFAASLADFATPLILAGNAFPVLPTEAYLQITARVGRRCRSCCWCRPRSFTCCSAPGSSAGTTSR
jgi:iron(III) transport system permease protein